MNKSGFNELLLYIKNRPAEAQRLRDALGLGEGDSPRAAEALSGGQHDEWLTAAQVGKRIGRSRSWVRLILPLLPEEAVTRSQGVRRTLYINYTAVSGQLNDIMIR